MTEWLQHPWAEGLLLGYDVETDGVLVEEDRIVSATIVVKDPGSEPVIHEWLINTGREIPRSATDVHGITTEHMHEHGQDPAVAIREIWEMLSRYWCPERPLVGHNPTFDLTITDREIARHLGEALMLLGPVIDTLTIDREQDKYVRGSGQRKLVPACARYGLPEFKAHNATADVLACMKLAWAESRRFPYTVGLVPPAVLHERQKVWYRNWATGYARYLHDKQISILDRSVKYSIPAVARQVLGPEVELTLDNIATARAELVARAQDVVATSGDWPLRPRPAAAEVA